MKTNRRGFIGSMLAAGSAPLLFGGCAGLFKGNSRINVAVIGCGRISNEFEIPCVLSRKDVARIVIVMSLRMDCWAKWYKMDGGGIRMVAIEEMGE